MKQQPFPQQKPEAPQEDTLWIDYDAQNVLSMLEKVAGKWADIDTDTMIAQVYTARERGSKPTA